MTPVETFKDFEERGPWRYRVDMIRTHDGGATWGESAPAHWSDPESDPANLMCWDPRLAYMNDMIHFAFGHPTGAAVGPRDAIAIWYAGDETRTAIWGAFLQVS
jgi:hypothetical protein